MKPDHTHYLAGGFVQGDKGHGSGVVELGQARDELVGKLLHRPEESKPQVVAGHVPQQLMDQRFIFRPDWADEYSPIVLDLDVTLPLRRIGPDGEVGEPRAAEFPFRAA